jgi:hypothetical protein
MKMRSILMGALALLTPAVGAAAAEDATALMNAAHAAYYYAGDGGSAKVLMTLTDKQGRTREREFWMLRTDIADMGDQNYYTYFVKPADVSKTGFLVHKHADGNDDRWLYVPALDLVKRIAADDRTSSFVGSDFTYEDVSGRLPVLDAHTLIGEESLGERPAWKIKSTPKVAATADWQEKLTWICKESKLPLKEEYYTKGELTRVFEASEIKVIDGFPTATMRTMKDLKRGKQSTIRFAEISYQASLPAADFSERLLKNPPREYTR